MHALALIICTIFVLLMLRFDHKQSPEVSSALWIPTVWMLLIASKPLGIWFQSVGATNEEGSSLDQAVLIALFCLGMMILVARRFNWLNVIKENIWLILLIVFMLASCIWSDIPLLSFKRWIREVIAVIMAFIVATEPSPKKALESLLRRLIYILIPFSYILIQYFGEYGRAYIHNSGDLMWIGVTLHKNQLGQLCIIAVLFLIWTIIRKFQGRIIATSRHQVYFEAFLLILTFWCMGGPNHSFSYSATSAVTLTVELSVLLVLYWKKNSSSIITQKAWIVLIVFIFIYGTVTPVIGKLSIIDISSAIGRQENLTGRTSVWAQVVPVAMSKPILGHGYGGFWTTQNREVFDISGSHNGYLDVILELGFAGLFLYLMFFLSSMRKALNAMVQDFDWGVLMVCSLIMAVIQNITEASLNTFTSRIMAIILFLMVLLSTATSNTLLKNK